MDLRVVVVTDRGIAGPRSVPEIVRDCLAAGAPAVQLRDKQATARELYEQTLVLRRLTAEHDALLFVNDRFDVALAAGADGVHVGPGDVPLEAVLAAVPHTFLVGFSTDDPFAAKRAVASGAAYIGCGAVFGTQTKREVAEERIGLGRLESVVQAAGAPVVAIGGIGPDNAGDVAGTGAAGVAAVRSIMAAEDPGAVIRALLAAFS